VSARDIVNILVALEEDNGAEIEHERGPAAVQIAREMEAALMTKMEQNLGHVLLWEQFLRTPTEVDAALVSVLHELMSRDAVLTSWLHDSLERYWHAE
jgi:hypothetical protein